jgi:hypothetical protein
MLYFLFHCCQLALGKDLTNEFGLCCDSLGAVCYSVLVIWKKKERKKERPLCAGLFLQRPGDMDKKVIHVKKERECRRASALVILISIWLRAIATRDPHTQFSTCSSLKTTVVISRCVWHIIIFRRNFFFCSSSCEMSQSLINVHR